MSNVAIAVEPLEEQAPSRERELLAEIAELRMELAIMKTRAGDIEPPKTVTTPFEARVWFCWAKANHHNDGCMCRRCLLARHLVRND